MKKLLLSLFAGTLAAGLGTAAAATDCDKSAENLEAAIKKEPEAVLLHLTRSLSKSGDCACELVKIAIEASDADIPMVRQIVTAAVMIDGVKAATVAECATAVKPEAASEIKAALSEVYEGADKGDIVVVEDPVEDFDNFNQTVSGVYMIPPIAGGRGVDERQILRDLGFTESSINRILSGQATAADIIREQIRRRTGGGTGGNTTPPPQSP